jgi:hypothetical protein
LTSPIRTGTSTSGPITVANATCEPITKTATATAVVSSKLFEAAAIRSAIGTPHLRTLFDVLLDTGLHYAEMRQLRDDPALYDAARGTLAIVTRSEKQRTVVLGDRGRAAVLEFIESGAMMPGCDVTWKRDLIRWSAKAGLSPHPDPPVASAPGNPYGIGVASTRKTWESWLYALYPGWLREIMSSQGRHWSEDVERYGALAWSAQDLDAMRLETAGWEPLPYGPDIVREIVCLDVEGVGVHRIAEETSLAPCDVRAYLAQVRMCTLHCSPFNSPGREVFEERGAELIEAYEAGRGLRELAAEVGVSYETLRKFPDFCGVRLRGAGPTVWR